MTTQPAPRPTLRDAAQQIFSGAEHDPFVSHGAPNRPSAFLLHGYMGTPAELRPLAERLHRLEWSAAAELLPGFGRLIGDLPTVRSVDWLTAAQRGWLTASLRPGAPRVLIGFSMGGALAVQLAAQVQPDYLVLLAPFTRFADRLAKLVPLLHRVVPSVAPFARADFADPDLRRQFRAMSPDLDIDDPAVQEWIRTEMRLPTGSLAALHRVGRQALDRARGVRCPTLVVQGSADRTVPPQLTRQLLANLAGPLAYHEIPAGHDLLKTHPDQVAELIAHFVERA